MAHSKMLNFTGTGIAHWFVMIGFVTLLGTLVTAFVQVVNPNFSLPIIGHWVPYEIFTELIGWLTGIGIVTLIGIRQITRLVKKNKSRFFGSTSWKAYFVESVIAVVVICVLTLRGLEGAIAQVTSWNWHYALSYPIVSYFNSLNLSMSSLEHAIQVVAAIKVSISMIWFIVIAANLTMGVAWHRFLAPFNIYFKRNPGEVTLGALP
ncbi:MAG: Fe-S oxidoreductase, partial [Actinobacteria bacterium]|nr:Fe-S oxidoreductase [Actinomycetota bacterium]